MDTPKKNIPTDIITTDEAITISGKSRAYFYASKQHDPNFPKTKDIKQTGKNNKYYSRLEIQEYFKEQQTKNQIQSIDESNLPSMITADIAISISGKSETHFYTAKKFDPTFPQGRCIQYNGKSRVVYSTVEICQYFQKVEA